MALELDATTKLLFVGDSITDCGRREDPEGVGNGFVRMVRDYLCASDPTAAPQVINRGISGDQITDLAARWQKDVIDLAPDVLSVKIGINDVWHGLAPGGKGIPVDQFRMTYHECLSLVRILVPKCQLVLCEPTVIWPPQPIDANERLVPYVEAINEIAAKLEIPFVVPLHDIFEDAKTLRPDINWAPDGVHPSSVGHMLIARSWLETTGWL